MTEAAAPSWHLLVFTLQGRQYALALDRVERVLPMLDVTPLPRAPERVAGVVDLHGELVPVFNLRRRLGLPERPAGVNDPLILARTRTRRVGFGADAVIGVVTCAAEAFVPADSLLPGLDQVKGVAKLEAAGLVLIHDLDTFLSAEEEQRLSAALSS